MKIHRRMAGKSHKNKIIMISDKNNAFVVILQKSRYFERNNSMAKKNFDNAEENKVNYDKSSELTINIKILWEISKNKSSFLLALIRT